MKRAKRILLVLLAVILLLAGTAYVLVLIYKDDLSEKVITAAREKYGAIIEVGQVNVSFWDNWPRVSVEFADLKLRSTLAPQGSEDLLKAKSVALAFNLRQLLQGKIVLKRISVSGANVFLVRQVNDSANFIFKNAAPKVEEKDADAKFELDLQQIHLKNCKLKFENLPVGQHISIQIKDELTKLQQFSDGAVAQVNGSFISDKIVFNSEKGSFLEALPFELKAKVVWFKKEQSVVVMPGASLSVESEKYTIAALFEENKEKRIAIVFDVQKGNFEKIRRMLPKKIRAMLSGFNVEDKIAANATIVSRIGRREEPYLNVQFSGKNHNLTIGNSKVPYKAVNFKGSLVSLDSTHTHGEPDHARITIAPITGKIYNFPFTATVALQGLTEPQLQVTGNLNVNASDIDFKVAKDFILQGKMTAVIKYTGPASNLNTKQFLDAPMKLRASLYFQNISYREFNKRITYVVNGKAMLSNRDVLFEALHLKTVFGNAVIKGSAQNFVPYLLGYTNGFKAKVVAKSENIDLNPLFELKGAKPAEKKVNANAKSNLERISDSELSHFDLSVQLFTKRMLVRKVLAEAVAADITYKNNLVQVNSLSANSCGGKIQAKVSITNFTKLSGNLSLSNVDVTTLFTQFENFGQDAIVSENLKGTFTGDAKVNAELSNMFEFIPGSIKGTVNLKLRDGHLINFEPLQNLSSMVFRKRDFQDIAFSELKENLQIDGFRVKIDELEVASSVLNFYVVDGIYNYRGTSNINLLVPWSNLKKRKKNELPAGSGQSASDTRGIKLNYRGQKKNMKLSFGHQSSQGI